MAEGRTEVSQRRKAKAGRTDHEKKIGHACLVLNMVACMCCRSVGRHALHAYPYPYCMPLSPLTVLPSLHADAAQCEGADQSLLELAGLQGCSM